MRTSGQDGGIGRNTVPPCTTKRRTTTNLKTKNNQRWQKIKLYGSSTTKEIKKKHSSRPVGGAEMGSRGREDLWQGGGWRTQRGGGLWSRVGKAAAGWRGSSWWTRWQTAKPRVPAWGNKASNHPLKTPVGVEVAAGETPSLTGEFVGETHRVLECTHTHPPGISTQFTCG